MNKKKTIVPIIGTIFKMSTVWMKLNVGGVSFETTKETLSGAAYFNSLLSGNWKVDDIYRIDRSGQMFEEVLRLLRNPEYNYPRKKGYIDELDFYGIKHNLTPVPDIDEVLMEEIVNIKKKTGLCKTFGCPFDVAVKHDLCDRKEAYCIYCLPDAHKNLDSYFHSNATKYQPTMVVKYENKLYPINRLHWSTYEEKPTTYSFSYNVFGAPYRRCRYNLPLEKITIPSYQEAAEWFKQNK